jgi:branched-chain amino acid aminotransferase
MIKESEWIWRDGELVPWHDANVHLLSLAVQFGSSIFEGVRAYATPDGPAIFRWQDHLRRLYDSCRIYRMDVQWTGDQLTYAAADLIHRNKLGSCYLRPMVLRGYGDAGMMPKDSKVETYLACWAWGAYHGDDALENGVDVCVSSWQRPAPNTYPTIAKAAGHYNNSQLIRMEAVANGYAEAIATGPSGLISEGSGQNVFLVRDNVLMTSPVDGTILNGITRAAIITLADDLGIKVEQRPIPREMLYIADEVFFTGTAAEVTPVRSVDRIAVGTGRCGPITRALQQRYLGIAEGRIPDDHGWLTHVNQVLATPAPAMTAV